MTKKFVSLLVLMLLFVFQSAFAQENGEIDKSKKTQNASYFLLKENVKGKVNSEKEVILLEEFEKRQKALYPKHAKSVTQEKQSQLDEVIEVMDEEVPNSFSWNYATYMNSNRSSENIENLEQAYSIKPEDLRVLTEYIAVGEMQQNSAQKKEFCQKLNDKNIYSEAEKEYNSNVLISVQPGAYLITNGNLDTYPAWIEQELNGVGKKTKILNLDLLQNPEYRKSVLNTMGIPALEGYRSNEAIIDHILSHKKDGEIYLGLTVAHHILIKYSKHLYLSGLALVYNTSPDVDYNKAMDKSWKNDFNKSHIKDKQAINKNYLLMLKKLYVYYQQKNMTTEADEVKKLIEIIVKNFGLRNPLN